MPLVFTSLLLKVFGLVAFHSAARHVLEQSCTGFELNWLHGGINQVGPHGIPRAKTDRNLKASVSVKKVCSHKVLNGFCCL